MSKHAYLIIAHKSDFTLYTLLKMLDYPENDIFIHMDKKNVRFSEQNLPNMKYSNITIVYRIKVTWGGYSLIEAEIKLLDVATQKNNYLYYHLISGQDLPIKTQNYIHEFFDKNYGKEFIDFYSDDFAFRDRVRYYYPLQEYIGNDNGILRVIAKVLNVLQVELKINRNSDIIFRKGAQWFSITDRLAKYLVSKRYEIKEVFRNSLCCDEIFCQTIVYNTPDFYDYVYSKQFNNQIKTIGRFIDWKRGNPYIFRNSDLKDLLNNDALFARKFDPTIDSEIIVELEKCILNDTSYIV